MLGINKTNTLKWNELIKEVVVILEIMLVSVNVLATELQEIAKENRHNIFWHGLTSGVIFSFYKRATIDVQFLEEDCPS